MFMGQLVHVQPNMIKDNNLFENISGNRDRPTRDPEIEFLAIF